MTTDNKKYKKKEVEKHYISPTKLYFTKNNKIESKKLRLFESSSSTDSFENSKKRIDKQIDNSSTEKKNSKRSDNAAKKTDLKERSNIDKTVNDCTKKEKNRSDNKFVDESEKIKKMVNLYDHKNDQDIYKLQRKFDKLKEKEREKNEISQKKYYTPNYIFLII
ncbi:hypothetical protein EDEG_01950 [Edhazardia aedis USNM 41457]|uniref:Uncharacterized protein n=1 Tax=Edhazardia aedis (strain USNM 41457) TaxID=1003232 RepID=J9DMD3_EDHAE|nr:hypothetical protein EDEG_01950 [Edhazardia aedis USNM 41457]|eukprot:EJW03755.1 hypothetical protein EDEG_01950 [Edhazardia aedis USNM 41457]